MGNLVDRVEEDRRLYEKTIKDQLYDLVESGNSKHITNAIVKVIQLQVVTEEIAKEQGVDIDQSMFGQFVEKNPEYVSEQVDRAITKFIGAVYSQES